MPSIDDHIKWYDKKHIQYIPLIKGSKLPIHAGWNKPYSHNIPTIEDHNIGLLCGTDCGLFAIDIDHFPAPDWYYTEEFQRIRSKTRVHKTARGEHILLRGSAIVQSASQPGYDIKGRNRNGTYSYIVAPPSYIDETGHTYTIQPTERTYSIHRLAKSEIETLQNLIPGFVYSYTQTTGTNPAVIFSTLPQNHKYIVTGQYGRIEDSYRQRYSNLTGIDRSRADMAVLKHLYSIGWNLKDAITLYRVYANNELTKYGSKEAIKPGYGAGYIKQAWNNIDYIGTRSIADEDIDRCYLFAPVLFDGRTATTDTLFTRALLWGLKRSNPNRKNIEFSISIRDMSLVTGVSKDTLTRAKQRLVNMGYITLPKHKESDSVKSNLYRFTSAFFSAMEKDNLILVHTNTLPSVCRYVLTLDYLSNPPVMDAQLMYRATTDSHTATALNKNSDSFIDYLNQNTGQQITINDIHKATGLHKTTIKNKLLKLEKVIDIEYGTVKGKTRPQMAITLHQKITESQLARLAEILNTAGNKARRDNTIMQERKVSKKRAEQRRESIKAAYVSKPKREVQPDLIPAEEIHSTRPIPEPVQIEFQQNGNVKEKELDYEKHA